MANGYEQYIASSGSSMPYDEYMRTIFPNTEQGKWEARYGDSGSFSGRNRTDWADRGGLDNDLSGFFRGYSGWLKGNTKFDGITRANKGQWADWAASDPAYRASDLNPRPGETRDSWLGRIDKDHFPGFSEYMKSQPGFQDFADNAFGPESGPGGQKLDDYQKGKTAETASGRKDVMGQIQAFADQLTKPFDPNDPEIKQIMTMSGNRAADQARLQGVQGPAGLTDQMASMNKTGLAAYGERKNLGLSALGLLENADTARMQQQFQQKQADLEGMRFRQSQQLGLSELHKENHAAPWRTALSIGSSIVGGLAAPFTGGLSLAGSIPGLASSMFGGGGNNQNVSGGGSNGYSSAGGGAVIGGRPLTTNSNVGPR